MKTFFSQNLYYQSFLNSYAQLFFANHKGFAYLLLLSTFVNLNAGLSGIIAVITAIACSRWLGLNKTMVSTGIYTYSSLLTGVVMGIYYNINSAYFLLLILASVLALFVSVWLHGMFAKRALPLLALPFLITVWIVILSIRSFPVVTYNESGIYRLNEIYALGGFQLLSFIESLNQIQLPVFIDVYFKSIGAIFFQYNLISGILISIGLLIYSRIAFSLSILGFYTGYLFYFLLGSSFHTLNYGYVGFNFILSAISLGGFYLIPSRNSYFLVILISPIIALVMSALLPFFINLQLPVYALPFNLVVITTILVLRQRQHFRNLYPVNEQLFSPEKNLYSAQYQYFRFSKYNYLPIHLPFFGTWKVSQGYNSKPTHQDDWKEALDFVVTDKEGLTYRAPGTDVEHYYCYQLPVLAPAAGYVVKIESHVEDNAIGNVNLKENWGNTVIIKHHEYVFSKLSHLKPGSIKVEQGQYVRQGEIVALCGSSGRSPEPHLHFQIQNTPYIGSKTIPYPLAYFIKENNNQKKLCEFEIPNENDLVSKVNVNAELKEVFRWIPGKILMIEANGKTMKWQVFTDSFGYTYLYCFQTNSTAYFIHNETVFYFTRFYGDENSALFLLYTAIHKILLSKSENIVIDDIIPVPQNHFSFLSYLNDFIAPFKNFYKTEYKSFFNLAESNDLRQYFKSEANVSLFGKSIFSCKSQISIESGAICEINIQQFNQTTCIRFLKD